METNKKIGQALKRFGICVVSLIVGLSSVYAGKTETKNVNVGDTFTVHTTSHSYIQSVLWDFDYSVVEPQGRFYDTTTSMTFKALQPVSPYTVIQTTTYYYKNGTTSSGINKDVDVFKIYIDGNSGNSQSNVSVSLSDYSTTLHMGGDSEKLIAYIDGGSYTGKYNWTNSNTNNVFMTVMGNYVYLKAKNPGSSTITVTLDNGKSDSCFVNVAGTPASDVSLPNSIEIYENSSATITATLSPSYALATFFWRTEDYSIAEYSADNEKCTVTGKEPGETRISVEANGHMAYCHVKVLSKASVSETHEGEGSIYQEKDVLVLDGFREGDMVTIYSTNGSELHKSSINTLGKGEINIANYPKGIYIVRIQDKSIKIIKG